MATLVVGTAGDTARPTEFPWGCPWLLFSVDRRCPDKKREGSFVEEKLNEMAIWKAP